MDKVVGKVTSFYLRFYFYPPPLVQCWKKLSISVVILCLTSGGIEFHEFLSERSEIFRPRSRQTSDEVARGLAPYKNRTKDFS